MAEIKLFSFQDYGVCPLVLSILGGAGASWPGLLLCCVCCVLGDAAGAGMLGCWADEFKFYFVPTQSAMFVPPSFKSGKYRPSYLCRPTCSIHTRHACTAETRQVKICLHLITKLGLGRQVTAPGRLQHRRQVSVKLVANPDQLDGAETER